MVIACLHVALQLNPTYGKVLLRRAGSYERMDKLEDALAGWSTSGAHVLVLVLTISITVDYKALLSIDPHNQTARDAVEVSNCIGDAVAVWSSWGDTDVRSM